MYQRRSTMKIKFTESSILKKYNLNCKETIEIEGEEPKTDESDISVAINFDGNSINYLILNFLTEKEGEAADILEKTNNIFDNLRYTLDENGNIMELVNTDEIKDKWGKLKQKEFSRKYEKRDDIKDLLLEITRLVNNKEQLNNVLIKYSILPHLFLGVHNRNLDNNSKIKIERRLYDVFPLEIIPIVYEVCGEEDDDLKIVTFTGKERNSFDRFKYVKKVRSMFPDISKRLNDDVNVKIIGKTYYDLDNLVNTFEMKVEINISRVFNYILEYKMNEKIEE